jgi:hypothetical protein
MSAVNQPTRTVLRDGDSGKILMELEQADISRLLATGFRLPEPFSATAADGKTLCTACCTTRFAPDRETVIR